MGMQGERRGVAPRIGLESGLEGDIEEELEVELELELALELELELPHAAHEGGPEVVQVVHRPVHNLIGLEISLQKFLHLPWYLRQMICLLGLQEGHKEATHRHATM